MDPKDIKQNRASGKIAHFQPFGPIPARTETTVLSADDPNQVPLGLVIRERSGGTVYLLDQEGLPLETPLMDVQDLRPDLRVAVPTMFGYVSATVVEREGKLWWDTAGSYGNLVFDEDERHCWTSSLTIRKSISRLELSSK